MGDSQSIWEQVKPGAVIAAVGVSVTAPPAGAGWRVLRVPCGGPVVPLGPFLKAREQLERLVDQRSPILDLAASRLRTGLRRRLLFDGPQGDDAGAIVGDLNRLVELIDGPVALILEGFELADPATVALTQRVAKQPGRSRLALVLALRRAPAGGATSALIASLEEAEAVVHGQGAPELPAAQGTPLSGRARLALRAGAIVGEAFEAKLLARLLDLDPLRVLEALQEAHDAGAPLEDLGDGCFRLPAERAAALRAELLPSLAKAWNRRLATLLTEDTEAAEAADAEPPATPAPAPAPVPAAGPAAGPSLSAAPDVATEPAASVEPATDQAASSLGALAISPDPVPEPLPEAPIPDPSRDERGLAFGSWTEPVAPAAPKEPARAPLAAEGWTSTPTPPAPQRAPKWRAPRTPLREAPQRRRPPSGGVASQARAAGHFAEAGELEEAVERYLEASRAAPLYALPQTLTWMRSAERLLSGVPESPRRLHLRARLHMERGRLRWLGAGQGPTLHLDGALAELDAAAALLDRVDDPRLRAELGALIAQVCYDRGDEASLERALRELDEATRALQSVGEARAAARLLNDQAAVWVRIGDVVRAAHLLRESRGLFSRLTDPSDEDRAELAETNHLLARLPLHVPPRPGLERESLQQALTHAQEADASYGALRMGRDRARCWETMGRLLAKLGEVEGAHRALIQAVEAQQSSGDALGLARSAASLSLLMAQAGQPVQALELLSASVDLNQRMHSARGLRYNKEALQDLLSALEPEVARQLAAPIEGLALALAQAETQLGLG